MASKSEDNRRAADSPEEDRLVHGLLSAWADLRSGEADRRASLALEALDQPTSTPTRRVSRRTMGSFALAAALLFAVILARSDKADAAQTLAWLERVASEAIDRRYRFAMEFHKPRPLGHSAVKGEFVVRGAIASLQRLRIGEDRELTIGRQGGKVWVMGKRGPLLIRNREDEPRWGPAAENSPPLLSVAAVLEKVRVGYRLEFAESKLPGAKRLVATSETPGGETADAVTLDYDTGTGDLQRIELRWSAEDRPKRLALELEESLGLPPDWYEHTNHHGPERRVIDRSTPNPGEGAARFLDESRPNRVPASSCS